MRDLMVCRRGKSDGQYVSYLVQEGLANRLKAHLAAGVIAQTTGRTLRPVWRTTQECPALYSDLFVDAPADDWHYQSSFLIRYDERLDQANWRAEDDGERSEDLLILDLSWQYIWPGKLANFAGGGTALQQLASELLAPLPIISTMVDHAKEQWRPKMIGVHVRRGDFHQHGQVTDINQFVKAIDRALDDAPEAGLFVASDGSVRELASLLDRYSDRLIFRSCAPREALSGAREALVDLFLLSHCERLVLSRHSSFGTLASLLGNVRYEYA